MIFPAEIFLLKFSISKLNYIKFGAFMQKFEETGENRFLLEVPERLKNIFLSCWGTQWYEKSISKIWNFTFLLMNLPWIFKIVVFRLISHLFELNFMEFMKIIAENVEKNVFIRSFIHPQKLLMLKIFSKSSKML